MKFRAVLSIFFIIATLFVSIHEIEHISVKHDSSLCQICIINDHLVSGDITSEIGGVTLYSFNRLMSKDSLLFKHSKKVTNHSTAPPKIS